MVDDPELLDLVELEVRELLTSISSRATICRDSGLGAGRAEWRAAVGRNGRTI